MKLIAMRHRLIKRLPFAYIPGYKSTIRKFHDLVLFRYPYETAKNFLHAGSVRRVNVLGFDVFDGLIDVEFEGHTFQSMARYHEYLTHCFGDYMQFPPEDQRHPYHGGTYYWK